MKVVVIGGTGLIGTKLVSKLKSLGHEAVAASPSTGVNVLTGEGLAVVLKGANVVVDVANSPSFETQASLEFFQAAGKNIFAAEKDAAVGHHVVLSIVGTDRFPESGYFQAKLAQENLVKASGVPYTIVRATQFFEFLGAIAQSGTAGKTVRLPPVFLQPIAAEDVAAALLNVVLEKPLNGIVEIAGPERFFMPDAIRLYLQATNDPRVVVADSQAGYFGAKLSETTLVPEKNPRLGSLNFKAWFAVQ